MDFAGSSRRCLLFLSISPLKIYYYLLLLIQARFKPTNFILNQKNAYHIQNVDFWMKTYRKHRNLILAITGNSWYIQLSFRSKSIKIFSLIEEKIFWDYEEI